MFEKRIVHSGLNAYRLVRGQTQSEVKIKADLQEALWAERWLKKVNADRIRDVRAKNLQQRSLNTEQTAAAKTLALEQTRELENGREHLEKLLLHALGRDPRPDWEKKKDKSSFAVAKPSRPKADLVPTEPDPTSVRFNPIAVVPNFSLLDK